LSSRACQPERALLVQLKLHSRDEAQEAEELRLLALSAGAEIAGVIFGSRQIPDAATFIGKGKAEEVRDVALREAVDLVIVNHELSPAQERNLEKIIERRVLDRTGLILDIFAQRARSHEGKLQVELAQLAHLATRLVRGWTHLERQKGGIGLRGPGETQLEVDRRLIRDRIKKLNERLAQVTAQRRSRRRARDRVPIPTVSLVGYTNAGKSSLFNRLTGSSVYAADQLFATLDPTMRRVELPGNAAVILADTVGFIRNLPHDLVEAFKSTLEEVAQADLLLHVVDSANPDKLDQMREVNAVLTEIGANEIPQVVVFNKIDLTAEAPRAERDDRGRVVRLWLSTKTGDGIDHLLSALSEHYRQSREWVELCLPPEAARLRALLYDRFEIVSEKRMDNGDARITVALDLPKLNWLKQQADFHDTYLVPVSGANVLAATGS
jgi:GTP-binding protein HflX